MSKLIKINLLSSLRPRLLWIITVLFIVLGLTNSYKLSSNSSVENINVNVWDFLLLSVGGLNITANLWDFLGWISVIVPIILFVHHLREANRSLDLFMFVRSSSRIRWWLAKIIALTVIVLSYSLLLFFVQFLTGIFFFSFSTGWSSYTAEMYPLLVDLNWEPIVVFCEIFIIFVSGLLAFSMIAQTLSLFWQNTMVVYVVYLIASVVLGRLYLTETLSRASSPLHYASFVDLIPKLSESWAYMGINLGICLIVILISLWRLRNANVIS
jgi:hypothetical protein